MEDKYNWKKFTDSRAYNHKTEDIGTRHKLKFIRTIAIRKTIKIQTYLISH